MTARFSLLWLVFVTSVGAQESPAIADLQRIGQFHETQRGLVKSADITLRVLSGIDSPVTFDCPDLLRAYCATAPTLHPRKPATAVTLTLDACGWPPQKHLWLIVRIRTDGERISNETRSAAHGVLLSRHVYDGNRSGLYRAGSSQADITDGPPRHRIVSPARLSKWLPVQAFEAGSLQWRQADHAFYGPQALVASSDSELGAVLDAGGKTREIAHHTGGQLSRLHLYGPSLEFAGVFLPGTTVDIRWTASGNASFDVREVICVEFDVQFDDDVFHLPVPAGTVLVRRDGAGTRTSRLSAPVANAISGDAPAPTTTVDSEPTFAGPPHVSLPTQQPESPKSISAPLHILLTISGLCVTALALFVVLRSRSAG